MIESVTARSIEMWVTNKGKTVEASMVECPDCFSLVLRDKVAEHIEWHGDRLVSSKVIGGAS